MTLSLERQAAANRVFIGYDNMSSTEEFLALYNQFSPMGFLTKLPIAFILGLPEQWFADNNVVGKKVFIDFKLHDIGNTTKMNLEKLIRMISPGFISYHTTMSDSALKQVAEVAAEPSAPKMFGITVLTDFQSSNLEKNIAEETFGVFGEMAIDLVQQWAARAYKISPLLNHFVCSPQETSELLAAVPQAKVANPGVRSVGQNAHDQGRIGTPTAALKAGAQWLVISRQIVNAINRLQAADELIEEVIAATA